NNGTFQRPTASFAATPKTGIAPLSVAFRDRSTGTYQNRLWSFGDGATSTETNPSHTYLSGGDFTVALTVSGTAGANTKSAPALIHVGPPPPPVPDFAVAPATGVAPLAVAFTDRTTGSVAGWTWDFGDGTSSTVQNPAHEYTRAGAFDV